MKKFFSTIFVSLLVFGFIQKAYALTFKEGLDASYNKPMVVLVYADWADDYQKYIVEFERAEEKYKNTHNFVKLDIASSDTKEFNKRFHIYPNLPYVLMFKDGGKVSRYIQKECANSTSCINSKIEMFAY